MFKRFYHYINEGQERSILVKKNIIGLIFLRGISIFLSLILVPLTIGYVTSFQYGIWLTLSSLTSWLSFFDIGLGNGMRMKFIEAIANGNKEKAHTYVSTTYALLSIVILIGWLLLMFVIAQNDWSKILNAPSSMATELKCVTFIVATSFCFQFILKLINTLLLAIQKPALSSSIDTISQLIITIIIFILVKTTHGSLISLALVTGSVYILVLFVASIYIFTHELKDFKPQWSSVDWACTRDLANFGLKFFFLQILAILFYATNNIIIAQILGPEDVSIYNVAYKYMNVISMGFAVLISPFWSAFADAYFKKDSLWMKTTYHKLLYMLAGLIGLGLIMLLCSPLIYKLWLGELILIPFLLTFLLYIQQVFHIFGSFYSTIIYGTGKIKIQMIGSTIVCILNVPITIYACSKWGVCGLIFAQICLSLLTCWTGPVQIHRILTNKAYGIWNQ